MMTDKELVAHFRPMMNDLDQGFHRMLADRPLVAHYTSMEVIEKILRTGKLWFSNPLFMNDLEEMRFGMNEGRTKFMTNAAIASLCASQPRFDGMQQAFDRYQGQFDIDHALDVYVFCLSEHDVDNTDGLLSMWRGYGGQGNGAALVFNTDFITVKSDLPLIVTKVKWLDRKITEYCRSLDRARVSDDKLWIIACYMFTLVKIFALTFKHSGFSEEREWRIIYTPDRDPGGILKDRLSYAIGRQGVEPKLKFKIEPLPTEPRETWTFSTIVEKIILGPSVASLLAQNSFRRMLQAIGRPELCDKVVASTIPLRPA
jgi:Protein of unknown function (DUF2971)